MKPNFMLSLISALVLFSCASSQPSRVFPGNEVPATDPVRETAAVTKFAPLRNEIPSPHAFLGWSDKSAEDGNLDPRKIPQVEMSCADKNLYATHPQSSLKLYHTTLVGNYNHGKMKWDDAACATPQPRVVPDSRRRCLGPDLVNYQIISDTFVDGCGKIYRGYWAVLFLTKDESMGTLVSHGRTVYKRAKSEFRGDFIDGQTNPVPASSFLFFSAPLKDDIEKIAAERVAALQKKFRYDEKTRLFIPL